MDRSSKGRRLKCMIGSLCVILIAFGCVDKKNRYGIDFNGKRSIIQLPLLDSSWEYSPSYTENVARSAILAHLKQMCWDFARRMRCKALRMRPKGAYSRTWPRPNSESNAAYRLRATVSKRPLAVGRILAPASEGATASKRPGETRQPPPTPTTSPRGRSDNLI